MSIVNVALPAIERDFEIATSMTGWIVLAYLLPRHAYTVKENLRSLLALSGTNPERAEIRSRLWAFYEQAASSDSPKVHRFASTIEAWWPTVEAAITTGYSNAVPGQVR